MISSVFFRYRFLCAILCFFIAVPALFCQNAPSSRPLPGAGSIQPGSAAESSTAQNALSGTYRGIALGMTIEEVKNLLLKDPIFGYRGERDVSLLPTQERTLIETAGMSFISRSWFQFYEGKLYTMSFMLNTDMMDYYSMFNTLEKKYGTPSVLNPEKAVWKDENVTLSLERPLTVKYIDTAVFDLLQGKSRVEQSVRDIQRGDFLNGF